MDKICKYADMQICKRASYLRHELQDVRADGKGGLSAAPDLLNFAVDGQRRPEGRRQQQTLHGGQVGLDAQADGAVLLQLLLHPLQRRRHVLDALTNETSNINYPSNVSLLLANAITITMPPSKQ